jgi:hypothetical protein
MELFLQRWRCRPSGSISNGGKIMAKKTLKKAKKLEATKPLVIVGLKG